jgi:tetratricopeptide (TPR) repeat protein
MAKNKGRSTVQDDELIDADEVTYEEEKTGEAGTSGGQKTFFEKYRNLLMIGGVALAAVIGYFLYQNSQKDKRNEEAQADMLNAIVAFERDSINIAINGDGQTTGLIDIVEDHSGTDAGNLARYYLGVSYLKQNNVDQGIEELENYKSNGSLLSAASHGALGYAYEQKGEFEKAAEAYLTASRTPEENRGSTPYFLMQAARNQMSAGGNEEALETYRKIKEKYPLSEQVTDGSVDRYISMLSEDEE